MEDPIYNRVAATPRPSLTAAGALILLASAGLWIASFALLLAPGWEDAQGAVLNALYYLPFVALPVGLYMARRRGLSDAMRLNPTPVLPTLAVVALAVPSVYVASALASGWELLLVRLGLRYADTVKIPGDTRALMLSIITMAAVPAVCEELLFRGIVLSAWESRGTRFAIGVTAVLFALMHGNIFGLPAYLLVGAIAGYLVYALDSLYAGIVYHTVYNAACLVIPYLVGGASEAESALVSDSALAVAIAVQLLMMLAMMGMILATLRLRRRMVGIQPIPRIRRPLALRERVMLLLAVSVMLLTLAITTALPLWLGGGA